MRQVFFFVSSLICQRFFFGWQDVQSLLRDRADRLPPHRLSYEPMKFHHRRKGKYRKGFQSCESGAVQSNVGAGIAKLVCIACNSGRMNFPLRISPPTRWWNVLGD